MTLLRFISVNILVFVVLSKAKIAVNYVQLLFKNKTDLADDKCLSWYKQLRSSVVGHKVLVDVRG